MRSPLIILYVSVVFSLSLSAQNPRMKSAEGMALGISAPEQIENFMYVVPGVGSSARDLLEQQSLKPYLMPVRKTGFRGNDLAYAAASCLEYYVNLGRNYKINLSPDFITLNLPGNGKNSSAKEVLGLLAEQGTVNAAIVPYDAGELTGAVFSTPKYDVVNYLHIFTSLTRDRQRVFEAKKALMKGNPVLVEIATDGSLQNQVGTRYLKSVPSGSTMNSLLVVGYDENEEAFELMSTWGSAWGNNGYVFMKYDDFGKLAVNGYVLLPEEKYP
ncbi:MAG: C1 family peptidase [Saprospiraceae bacterium]|nr:C1 family peptidase [Lewinella sp.]